MSSDDDVLLSSNVYLYRVEQVVLIAAGATTTIELLSIYRFASFDKYERQ